MGHRALKGMKSCRLRALHALLILCILPLLTATSDDSTSSDGVEPVPFFYGFYGQDLGGAIAPTRDGDADGDGAPLSVASVQSHGTQVAEAALDDGFYGFYGFYGLNASGQPHESPSLFGLGTIDALAATAPPQGGQIGGPASRAECDSIYGLCDDSFYGFYGLNATSNQSDDTLSLVGLGTINTTAPPRGAQIGGPVSNAECDSIYGLCDSFYGFYGLNASSNQSDDTLSLVGLNLTMEDSNTTDMNTLPRGGQIGGPVSNAECDSVYGLCESFYGFYGLNPNATNRTGSSSSLFGIGTVDGNATGDGFGIYYAHCSETPNGCTPNNWTSNWTHAAPKVTHPVTSAAGAVTSRDVYRSAVRDPRSLPPDVAPGASARNLRLPHGVRDAPTLLKMYPRSGPKEGGTNVTVHGTGFARTGREVCRFGGGPHGGQVHVVPARVLDPTRLWCESPRRLFAGYAVVTVSMDSMTFSGEAVAAAQGSGTFAVFNFTGHVPAGRLTLDNSTGPYMGGTLITVTLSDAVPVKNESSYFVPFNWTRRVYLDDEDVFLVDDVDGASSGGVSSDGSEIGAIGEFYGLERVDGREAGGAIKKIKYDGKIYDIVYPVNVSAADNSGDETAKSAANAFAEETAALFYGFALNGEPGTSLESASAVAEAAQKLSYNSTGCSYPTAEATMACMTSLKPYALVTIARAIRYTTKHSNANPVAEYGRFEPSRLASCMFVVPDHLLTYIDVDGVNTTVYEHTTSPATWLGYNKVQCMSPPKGSSRSDTALSVTMTVHVSNNGVDFSQEGAKFEYNDDYPVVSDVKTKQVAPGLYEARGPWSGNTEVYITGKRFFPSEHLTARFVTYEQQEDSNAMIMTGQKFAVECFYDNPTQIRCITPPWPRTDPLTMTLGSLKPCFEANVDVSNDNGTKWSTATPKKFLYCPVYVSTYGSNTWGEGTPRLPFRDISRGIMAALSEPRAYFIKKGKDENGAEMTGRQHRGTEARGVGQTNYINFDQILLTDGIYQTKEGVFGRESNLNLSPHGRVIEIMGQTPGSAYIDCDGAEVDALRPFDIDSHHGSDLEQHGSLSFKDVGMVRCAGYVRWETYDYNWRRPPERPEAVKVRTGRYVMETVCQMEPSFYGLNIPMGAAEHGLASESQTIGDWEASAAGGFGGSTAFSPMVRVCRNIPRWEWDPHPVTAADSALGTGANVDGGASELGGAILASSTSAFYGIDIVNGIIDDEGGIGRRRILGLAEKDVGGGAGRHGASASGTAEAGYGPQRSGPETASEIDVRASRLTKDSQWANYRAAIGQGFHLPDDVARKVQEQLDTRDGVESAASGPGGRGSGVASPSRRRFQGSRG